MRLAIVTALFIFSGTTLAAGVNGKKPFTFMVELPVVKYSVLLDSHSGDAENPTINSGSANDKDNTFYTGGTPNFGVYYESWRVFFNANVIATAYMLSDNFGLGLRVYSANRDQDEQSNWSAKDTHSDVHDQGIGPYFNYDVVFSDEWSLLNEGFFQFGFYSRNNSDTDSSGIKTGGSTKSTSHYKAEFATHVQYRPVERFAMLTGIDLSDRKSAYSGEDDNGKYKTKSDYRQIYFEILSFRAYL